MPDGLRAARMRCMLATSAPALQRLALDVEASAWLLEDDDPMRAYLELFASLPPEPAAWLEVLAPWLDDARHGRGPAPGSRPQVAALGALGVAGLRAARELSAAEPPLAAALRAVARWCFFRVRPSAA